MLHCALHSVRVQFVELVSPFYGLLTRQQNRPRSAEAPQRCIGRSSKGWLGGFTLKPSVSARAWRRLHLSDRMSGTVGRLGMHLIPVNTLPTPRVAGRRSGVVLCGYSGCKNGLRATHLYSDLVDFRDCRSSRSHNLSTMDYTIARPTQ